MFVVDRSSYLPVVRLHADDTIVTQNLSRFWSVRGSASRHANCCHLARVRRPDSTTNHSASRLLKSQHVGWSEQERNV
jgi:hypothetical protein